MKRNGLAMLAAALLAGCAGQNTATVGAPSTAAVRDQIHAAASNARSASESIRSSSEANAKIKGALRTVDDKLIILDRWLETHPKP